MVKKRKKRASTQKSSELNIYDLLTQFGAGGITLANKFLSLIEGLAHKRDLHKTYPYLGEAFSNVKTILGFFQHTLGPTNPNEVKCHESSKRTKRKKSGKKVSKQKTVRHLR